MQRIATLVVVIVAVAVLTAGVLAPGAAAAGETFVLTAGRQNPGWVAFAARAPRRADALTACPRTGRRRQRAPSAR